MAVHFRTEAFEGPLDLLLRLVEEEKLEITAVSLSEVTDQYVEHLEHHEIPKEELADFLVVAARLLLLKSRVLLPSLDLGLEEEGISLEDQLRMYKAFADAAKRIEAGIRLKRFIFPREKAPIQAGMFSPPRSLTTDRLAQVFREVIRSLEPVIRLPKAAVERAVSIQEKIGHIRALLGAQGEVSFASLVRASGTATEAVVTFLALLELVKQRLVRVSQDALFEDITIAHAKTAA